MAGHRTLTTFVHEGSMAGHRIAIWVLLSITVGMGLLLFSFRVRSSVAISSVETASAEALNARLSSSTARHFVPPFELASEADLRRSPAAFHGLTAGLGDGAGGYILGHEPDAPSRVDEYLEMVGPPWGPTFSSAAEVERAFPSGTVSDRVEMDMRHMAYSFAASAAPPEDGPYLLFVTLEATPSDVLPSMKWAWNLVLDKDCRFLNASSYFFQKFSRTSRRFVGTWGVLFPKIIAACKERRDTNQSLSRTSNTSESVTTLLDARMDNVNCIHETMCVPGEVLMYSLLCLARVFARYPTREMRKNVAILFPQVEDECAASRNTFGMLRRYFPELKMVFVPRDVFVPAPNVVYVSKFPQFSYFSSAFLQRELFPMVRTRLSSKLANVSKRIAVISMGNTSSTGRSFAESPAFVSLLEERGFSVLSATMPQDERLLILNSAEVLITSLGSNNDINRVLMLPKTATLPTLVLCHTGYHQEYSGLTTGRMRCSSREKRCMLVVSEDNDLSKVTGSQIDHFLAVAKKGFPSNFFCFLYCFAYCDCAVGA